MPLIIPKDLPAYEELQQENVFVMHQERAMRPAYPPAAHPDFKPDADQDRDRDPARPPAGQHALAGAGHLFADGDPQHDPRPRPSLEAFYKTFDEIKNERYDGMIITGAPIEDLDFEDVDYWDELCRIMDYTKENVYSTIHLCWGAQAGLYYHYGIRKELLPAKMFGVFEHRSSGPPTRWCAALMRCSMPRTAATPR